MTPSSPAGLIGLISTASSTEKNVRNFFLHNPNHFAFFLLYIAFTILIEIWQLNQNEYTHKLF